MALLALWNPNTQFLKTDGTINAGGKIVVTDHNDAESIPANYSDADGTTLNASPIVLDALGRATCYIDNGRIYDLYVKDANGATLWTVSKMTPGSETIVVRDGFSVSSNDSSVAVVISVDQNGVTNYDLSIQKEIDRATEAEKGLSDAIETEKNRAERVESTLSESIAGETERATKAEKASRTEIVAGYNITVEKTVGADGQDVYTVSDDREDNLVDDVRVNGASVVTDKVANIDVPVAGTASPFMDGNASVGNSLKYAREDHIHPSDTSREDIANKTTVVLGTSDSKYPTDKAVAEFVNSSIATNTANYISNNGEPFTSVEQLEAYSGTVTNNDYAFVTGTDSEGNTYYDRYKATVSGSSVTWALEYRLNNSSFTAAQWSAINSGITSVLVSKIHDHSNKDVLDGITSTDVANWNSKQNSLIAGDNITIDSDTISSNQVFVATYGTTKYAEVKAAYDAGKICIVKKGDTFAQIYAVTLSNIRFVMHNPVTQTALSYNVNTNNTWTDAGYTAQNRLTFDTAPKAGSSNPVTSDGIKTAINEKANGDNSVAIFDGYMLRMYESTGWRRLAYKQFNYTLRNVNALFRLYLFGSNNDHIGLGDLIVNIRFNDSGSEPSLVTCNLLTPKPLHTSVKVRVIGVAGNAVVELWFRPLNSSMLTLTCLGNGLDVTSSTKDWTFGRYLDATDPEPVEDIANNIYVFNGTEKRVQLDIDNPKSGNLVAMDEKGLVKDSGISITSSDVANWNSKMDRQTVGNVSEPVYIENGIAKIATNVATTGNLEAKLNVNGSNATTEGVTAMMKKVSSGSDDLDDYSYYFGDSNVDHTQIVRRPIFNIWNYIKNKVKTQLLGSVGSADKPIYLENGVPKVCADGVPYSDVSYGGNDGCGVFVGGEHNLANSARCYCTFLVTVASYPDNIAHTYIGTFTFRGGILNSELKCLTGTPAYPLRIAVVSTKDGGTTENPTYTVGLYVIPADKTYKYSSYKLTRIASDSDFNWDVKTLNSATYDELNSVAKPALKPIILTWDAKGSNVTTTGGTWVPSFDKATIIDCRGIVDMSIQVDLSIIGQRTYIDTLSNYEITLVNSSKTDILPVSLHQEGRMPRQAYSSSSTIDGTIDTSCTHRFIFPITSSTNLLAGYRPKITLPSNYTLDSGAKVSIRALCRGIVLPYGADEYF